MSGHLKRHQIRDFDALDLAVRGAALEHLQDCADCRAAWLVEEPSRVFALLARTAIPESDLDRLSERIRVEVDSLQATDASPRRGWFGVASIAASLLLAMLVGAVAWNDELPAGSIAGLDTIATPAPLDNGAEGSRLVALPGDDARVLDLNIGQTQVLIIFDESIEL